jgi:hypothetical protein
MPSVVRLNGKQNSASHSSGVEQLNGVFHRCPCSPAQVVQGRWSVATDGRIDLQLAKQLDSLFGEQDTVSRHAKCQSTVLVMGNVLTVLYDFSIPGVAKQQRFAAMEYQH